MVMCWAIPKPPDYETVDSLGRKHEPDVENMRFWLSVERDKADGDGNKPGTMSVEDAVLRRQSDGGPYHATGTYDDGSGPQLVDIEGSRRVIESVPLETTK